MAIVSLLAGPTGKGKSFSLSTMNPEDTLWIKVVHKPASFRTHGKWKEINPKTGEGNVFITDNFETIKQVMKNAKANGFSKIFIDDANYTLVNEFMRRSSERGYDKFTEMAYHVWDLIKFSAEQLDADTRVYMTWHTNVTNDGVAKLKFQGKLLEDQISIEGMLMLILEAEKTDGKYYFRTQNDGSGVAKSPHEMFDADLISNDLAMVDAAIVEYYDL